MFNHLRAICVGSSICVICAVYAAHTFTSYTIEDGNAYNHQQYDKVIHEIFSDDELFVLFYMDLALVIDPVRDTQIVEHVTTHNPWESLTQYLRGKRNIYFCPAGNQLNVAIEYMECPLTKGVLMSEQYGMYRLSSPNELFKVPNMDYLKYKKAVVFGGLTYDTDVSLSDKLLAFRGERAATGKYSYLKSSFDEAIYIDSLLRSNSIETALVTGEFGTRACINQIPYNNVDLLHIASHGFYSTIRDVQSSSLQKWMLSHSGLILSGADIYSLDDVNYGTLSAWDISQIDLSGLNLVVLSACDTGLGDIKENDVYGLYKGFKQAGAGTILVTLAGIDDFFTYSLMKKFYENLFQGENPRNSLKMAQQYMQVSVDEDYNRLWKDYILIDDLDRNVGASVSEETRKYFLETVVDVKSVYSEQGLFPNWDKIQAHLRPQDVVIRICPYKTSNSVDYVAMIGKSDGRCNVVRLFSLVKNRINGVPIVDDEGFLSLYNLPFEMMDSICWRKILPYIDNQNSIFLQSAGIMTDYPLEYLPSVADKFCVTRVSTLDILCDSERKFDIRTIGSAVLFGGLDYDSSYVEEQRILYRGASYALSYLPGTRLETDSISSVLRNFGIETILYQGKSGTESTFKALSGNKQIGLIHISTHGTNIGFTHNSKTIATQLLNNNAICFAIPDINVKCVESECNDGFLLGGEIATLDLSNISLIALCMCKPRMIGNEVANFIDSPWDIVKACKLAGVGAVLYSLWDVSDEATATLMINFYKNIVAGDTLKDSLAKAINIVRNDERWQDPKYWASFVLIDSF